MTARSRIEDLVKEKLLGRQIDGVGTIDALLELSQGVGPIRCSPTDAGHLQFELRAELPAFEVAVDHAVSKLRMLCARMAKLRQESGEEFEPYGGSGVITKDAMVTSRARLGGQEQAVTDGGMSRNGSSGASVAPAVYNRWKVTYKNTMGEQEFTIVAE